MKSGLIVAAALAVGLAGALAANSAHAALGGRYNSVEADRLHLSAQATTTTPAATYSVHTLALPNHGVVEEFTRADGTVFALAWHGPGRPDLRQLLGGYFQRFQADNALARGRRSRLPLHENAADLVVQTRGHPGAFWGVAYLPGLAPAGFSVSSLR